jgi:hypothetical protein
VQKIAGMIEVKVDGDIQHEFPEKCRSRVEIHTGDGRIFDSGLKTARGDWNISPFSPAELEAKFMNITQHVLERDKARELAGLIRDMEAHRIDDLIPYLARPSEALVQPLGR